MATQYSNKPIVTNGLVYALDFGNQKSYVSGSLTTRNLIYSQISGTIYNGITSGSLTNGIFNFLNSTTPGLKIDMNDPFRVLDYGLSYTISTTIKVSSGNNNQTIYSRGEWYVSAPYVTNRFALTYENGRLIHGINYFPTQDLGFGRGYNFNADTLVHLTFRYSSGSWDYFVNGIPQTSSLGGTYLNSSAPGNTSTFSGRGTIDQNNFTGSLGNFLIYNRSLTSDEIWSNYQLSAQRYGLGPQTPKPYLDENAYLFLQSAGITDPIITSSINTFVLGLKSASLWDKMIAIYPFVGTGSVGVNLTGSQRWNLKEPSLVTYPLSFTGSWNGSVSGSTPSGSGTNITAGGITPSTYYPNYSSSNAHISILSYDIPTSSSMLAGTGMTREVAVSTLAGDYGTPAAAYSVRKVRTAYSGALMDVRRSIDNVTSSIGYVSNGDLDTGSLLDWVVPGRNTLPGAYSGLAAAYSLRRVSGSYTGSAIQANNGLVYRNIGFDASGNLDTGSLTSLIATGSNIAPGSYSGLVAAYSLRRVTSSYSGFAIEVQSGSVSQSIGFDSFGNLDTGSLLTFAGPGNAFVKTWFDQSGNSRHVTQSLSTNQPLIVSSGSLVTLNSKPSIQFSNQFLEGTPFSVDTASIFTTLNVSSSVGYLSYFRNTPSSGYGFNIGSFSTSGWQSQFTPFLNATESIGNAKARTALKSLPTNQYLENWIYTSLPVLYENGNNTTVTAPVALWGTTPYYRIGALTDKGVVNANSSFSMQELTVYNLDQSSNRTYIENNINAYYNIYTTSSVSTENAFVSTWYDQSGNNRHATQTATGSQPLIVSSGSLVTEGTKPAVKFYTNLGMDTGFTGLVTKSLFIAANTEAGLNRNDNAQRLFSSYPGTSGAGNEMTIGGLGTGSFRYTDGGIFIQVSQSASYQLTTAIRNSTLNLAFNGGSINSGGAPNSSPNTLNYRIGEDGGSSSIETAKSIQEVLLYNNDQSANRSLIENNINNYYSIYTSSNAGYVARWYDQSGNNRHAIQTTAGSQPVIVSSGSVILTNNKPSLNFDNNKSLSNSTTTFNQPNTFYVVESASAAISRVSVYSTDISIRNQTYQDPQFRLFAGTDLIGSSTAYGHRLVTSVFNTANSTGFQNGILRAAGNVGTQNQLGITIGDSNYGNGSGTYQEVIHYNSNQSTNREAVEYGINNYYNIYPQTSSFTTSSFAIYATSGSVSASLNNDLVSGISSTGPLGFITVSRTGSNSLTIARNGVTSSFAVPASGALSTGIYLGAINNNGLALANSPLGISFASVGTGLSNTEVRTLNNLTTKLQLDLQRVSVLDQYPGARSAYSVRKLSKNYTGSAIQVIRSSDNAIADIGFNGFDLDTTTLLNFVGSGTSNHGYVRTWYDQSGFNNHVTQSTHTAGANVAIVLSGSLVTQGTKPALYMNGRNMVGSPFTASEMSTYMIGDIVPNSYGGYFYNRTATGFSFTILSVSAGTWSSLLVRYSASVDSSWPQSLQSSGYSIAGTRTGRFMESWNFSGSATTSTYTANGTNRNNSAGGTSGWAGGNGYGVGPTSYTGGGGGSMYFQEFIVYDRQQTSAIAIQDNLDQYFEVY